MSRSNYISRLPSEMVLHIFEDALPGLLLREGRVHFQAIRSVCSQWRLLSLSSPVLWSSLALHQNEVVSFASATVAAQRWLSRAGPSIPLELQLADLSCRGISKEDTTALVDLIIQHQSQWKLLSLAGIGRCLWEVFRKTPSTGWTNLRMLDVWTHDLFDDGQKVGLRVLQDSPSIQCTSMEELHLCIMPETELAPRDFAFISAYAHLRTLFLYMEDAFVSHSEPLTVTISLPSLEILSITSPDVSLLHHLDTPSLSNLELRPRCHDPEDHNDTLQNFITRCAKLHSVSICGIAECVIWMLPILSARPTIASVTIEPWSNLSSVGQLLDDTTWSNTWCPNLRKLTYVVVSTASTGEDEHQIQLWMSLAAFLRRRKDLGRARLDSLIIKYKYPEANFPYETFESLDVGQLSVMLPW
ncbi:hypothetical protein BKA70DRAFT_1332777 [Coprinopsis sp. MPI-PUGE-AT-0042]|nr:hypothetical protein BKA70DRAFT_1332777 [Coprinopsis sp. MPI-PUGE-AT-0042]